MLSTVRVPFPISSDTSALGPRAGIDPTSDSASGIGGAWRALHRPGDGGIPTSRPTGPPAAGRGPRAGGPERARRRLICLQTCLQSPRALPGEPGRALCLPRGAARIRTGDKGFAVLCLTTWPRRHTRRGADSLGCRPPMPERETGLEPATPTLARLCSTN